MKKIKGLVIILMLTVVGTNIVGCNKTNEENKIKNEENKVTTEKEEVVNYKALYKEELNGLIEKFGKFDDRESGYPVKGVKYADLLDFDKDEIPEMIVVHDKKVLLYKIIDGKAKSIYEGTIGSRYGQGDVSYRFGINTNGEKPTLIVFHSDKPWYEERISLVTVESDKATIKEIFAKTDGNNDTPIRDNLEAYYIDDKSTTADEYYSIYNSVVKDCKQIDASWNEEPATKSNLEAFLSSLE